MFLGHCILGAIQAVENQLSEVGEAHGPCRRDSLLHLSIDQVELVRLRLATDVEILSQLDVSISSKDETAAVAPSSESVGSEPINTKVVRRAVVSNQRGVAEIVQLRVVLVVVVGDLCTGYGCLFGPGKVQELLDLMRSDID